jgi:hypothetical protein
MDKKSKQKTRKWKIVEQVVAAAFDAPDVQVQKNVRLPSIRRKGGMGGGREIDVLITGRLAGQIVHFAIECKDHAKNVDSPAIDAFIGKLLDVGLPTQTSIFVSTSGFTRPAIERAQEVGMKTLVLSGADVSKTTEMIFEAIQSHIFMACSLVEVQFTTDEPLEEGSFQHILFYDKAGCYVGSLPDFFWKSWLEGRPPLTCGQYTYRVEVPDSWKYLAGGGRNSIRDIRVTYQVSALIFQLKGEAKAYHLVDGLTGKSERQTWRVKFPIGSMDAAPKIFKAEEELQGFLSKPARANVTVGRTRLPKVVMSQGMLWPMPSAIIEDLGRFPAEEVQKEILRFTRSEANSFWDFDEAYAELIKKMRANVSVTFRVERL